MGHVQGRPQQLQQPGLRRQADSSRSREVRRGQTIPGPQQTRGRDSTEDAHAVPRKKREHTKAFDRNVRSQQQGDVEATTNCVTKRVTPGSRHGSRHGSRTGHSRGCAARWFTHKPAVRGAARGRGEAGGGRRGGAKGGGGAAR